MMNSIITFLRYFIILLTSYSCSVYLYIKVSNISLNCQRIIYTHCSAFSISILCAFLYVNSFDYYGFLFFILTFFSIWLLQKGKYYITIPTIIITLAIQYVLEILSVLLMSLVFYFTGYQQINILTELCASLLQIVLIILFSKIKRTKNGFTFLSNKNNFGLSLLLSGPLIILVSIKKDYLSIVSKSIIAFGIFISSIGLILWIRSAFTRHYRKRLKARAEEYSKIELVEKEKEIEKLINENTSLSSIIHLDNYLINELETTLKNKNDDTINNLLALSKQRNEFVNNKIINDKLLPTTGNSEIDTVFTDIYIKAASRGIDFNLNVDCDINYLIHNIIEQSDFEKLISSCITNAIVDIESVPDNSGKIFITFSKPNDIYEFNIMDNGASKEDNSQSISKIIENSKASIKTNKYDNNDSFIKSLTIRFDGLKNNTAL